MDAGEPSPHVVPIVALGSLARQLEPQAFRAWTLMLTRADPATREVTMSAEALAHEAGASSASAKRWISQLVAHGALRPSKRSNRGNTYAVIVPAVEAGQPEQSEPSEREDDSLAGAALHNMHYRT